MLKNLICGAVSVLSVFALVFGGIKDLHWSLLVFLGFLAFFALAKITTSEESNLLKGKDPDA